MTESALLRLPHNTRTQLSGVIPVAPVDVSHRDDYDGRESTPHSDCVG